VNHYTSLNVTKLDILDGLKELKVAVAYKVDGEELPSFPADLNILAAAEPVYETFPGWTTPTTGLTQWNQLPQEAKNYIKFIEDFVGVQVDYIGVGPGREHMLKRSS
jgi:adenylosuccinate synthase